MNRTVRLLRLLRPTVVVLCTGALVPWATLSPDPVQEQLDNAVARGLDGIIVYVDQAGRVPALYAAGWKDRANQVAADPHALFKIASISKLYIAAATAKLVSDRVLSLDAPLADLLPDLAGRIEHADQITLRMLVQHRSGIPNFTDQEGFDWGERQTNVTDNLKLALDKPADFAPDTDYHYSNTNYLLIGTILDNALGYSHHRYIEEMLTPLGLTHTHALLSEVDSADVVSGYHHQVDEDLKGLDYVTPGGSMVATAQDVGIFLRALNDGSLLDADAQAIYTSIYEYGHTGWVPGYQSVARYHEDLDAVVVQLVSTTGGNSEILATIAYNRIVQILRES